ncbi:class I SAM-dependent methyltransferase [Methylomonas sp. ZR1]|uniref:class I SAM-dependent methyltransferase n=1 Tax=Methylomonas sp. ZR1 TaxID=1797072 RepID=UPI00149256D0|nr:methyltransferase domain-containing protein [Methylomonas sp. ZR1]NOV30125.1 methyltransferase domain-containing protein [Methylomonas sp. ZR1]
MVNKNISLYKAFSDPVVQSELKLDGCNGLVNSNGVLYKFVNSNPLVIDFIEPYSLTETDDINLKMYNSEGSTEIYRNFLNWLFETFDEQESFFRVKTINRLNLAKGMKVLVTGCGLGEDIPLIMNIIGEEGELHAQDFSLAMVKKSSDINKFNNLCFSVSNAKSLPYASRYFDAVYHFGGINLFGDIGKAISEMERVCKIGGKVLFGDEGIASHLRGTPYAEIAINNNRLWASNAPLDALPYNADNIEITYVLGNCFYLISFSPYIGFPKMNIDVIHKGLRGGTARTRYFGMLEGVTELSKNRLISEAKKRGISIHDLMEEIINDKLSNI